MSSYVEGTLESIAQLGVPPLATAAGLSSEGWLIVVAALQAVRPAAFRTSISWTAFFLTIMLVSFGTLLFVGHLFQALGVGLAGIVGAGPFGWITARLSERHEVRAACSQLSKGVLATRGLRLIAVADGRSVRLERRAKGEARSERALDAVQEHEAEPADLAV